MCNIVAVYICNSIQLKLPVQSTEFTRDRMLLLDIQHHS